MKKISITAFLFSSLFLFAKQDSLKIKKTVDDFFIAMKGADHQNMKLLLNSNALLQTYTNDKIELVKNQDMNSLLKSIGEFKSGDLDERINITNILTDGKIANVWMTYQFFFKGNISHCGSNSIQLIKTLNDEWKIQYILDTKIKCVNQ